MLISDNPVEECDATKAPFCTNVHPKIFSFLSLLLANQMFVQAFYNQK